MKVNETASKKMGALTGRLVAGAKSLPKKTADTSRALKDEFLEGFAQTNKSTKEKGSQVPSHNLDISQQ